MSNSREALNSRTGAETSDALFDTDAARHTIGSRILELANSYFDGETHSVAENTLTMVRELPDPADQLQAINAVMGALELERLRVLKEDL